MRFEVFAVVNIQIMTL